MCRIGDPMRSISGAHCFSNHRESEMPEKSERGDDSRTAKDASRNALAREQAAADKEVPVKQHNPDDKGLNPDQLGPAQPSTNNK
jgi:hypothetical protein